MTRPTDFAFFRLLARSASFTDAARSLSMTPSAVSRRLHAIESRLGTELVLRNTRSMRLTPQGERYLEAAETILRETERLEADIASRPLGRLRICASFGFGRTHIAPVVADFATANPDVRVDLTLTDRPVSIIEEGFDIGIHLGLPHDSRLRARRLLENDRILCASPRYLETHGRPAHPSDLARHRLIEIAEDENTVGRWTLTHRKTKKVVNLAAVPILRSNSGWPRSTGVSRDSESCFEAVGTPDPILRAGGSKRFSPTGTCPRTSTPISRRKNLPRSCAPFSTRSPRVSTPGSRLGLPLIFDFFSRLL